MTTHLFILKPSSWLGEGKIQLNMVEEELPFYTRWNIAQRDETGKIECFQEIQFKGLFDITHNQFFFYDLTSGTFVIELENLSLGKITGSGLITDSVIGWEFRAVDIGFEGFEFYEKQVDNTYLMRAEYATADRFRTVIKGKVWKKTEQE